jgi:hypothetical protein
MALPKPLEIIAQSNVNLCVDLNDIWVGRKPDGEYILGPGENGMLTWEYRLLSEDGQIINAPYIQLDAGNTPEPGVTSMLLLKTPIPNEPYKWEIIPYELHLYHDTLPKDTTDFEVASYDEYLEMLTAKAESNS